MAFVPDDEQPFLDAIRPDSVEDGFIQAIADTGDDDAVRLVYADWLEERGDFLRARFLRGEIECRTREPFNADVRRELVEMQTDLDPDWVGLVSRIPMDEERERYPIRGIDRFSAALREWRRLHAGLNYGVDFRFERVWGTGPPDELIREAVRRDVAADKVTLAYPEHVSPMVLGSLCFRGTGDVFDGEYHFSSGPFEDGFNTPEFERCHETVSEYVKTSVSRSVAVYDCVGAAGFRVGLDWEFGYLFVSPTYAVVLLGAGGD